MKLRDFLMELKAEGVVIRDATRHYKLYCNGRQTIMKRHPSQEISNCYASLIRKQLGLRQH